MEPDSGPKMSQKWVNSGAKIEPKSIILVGFWSDFVVISQSFRPRPKWEGRRFSEEFLENLLVKDLA